MKTALKTALMFTAIFAVTCGPFIYDGTGPGRACRVTYDRSFNGLYLIKAERCKGRLGIPRDSREIARKPLFTEF